MVRERGVLGVDGRLKNYHILPSQELPSKKKKSFLGIRHGWDAVEGAGEGGA